MGIPRHRRSNIPLFAIFLALATNSWCATWTKLTNPPPNGDSTLQMMLLTDGTVMLQHGGGADWLRFTPDAFGSYINGTWDTTSISPMSANRYYYSSEVLQNGGIWLVGGEYYGPNYDGVWTSNGEIWNPTTNTWSPTSAFPPQNCFNITYNLMVNTTSNSNVITNIPTSVTSTFVVGWTVSGPGIAPGTTITSVDSSSQVHISQNASASQTQVTLAFTGTPVSCHGDLPSMLLPGGMILNGDLRNNSTYLYNLATNSWSSAATKVYNDSSDEEGWVKLPDGRVLTYDIFQSINTGAGYAEIYDPVANTWSSISPADGTANGTLPLLSSDAVGEEMGPVVRLLDGRIFQVGANGATALYTPSTNTWAAGPNMVGSLNGHPAPFGADDAPAAVMPNGHVLISGDAAPAAVTSSGNTTAGSSIIANIPSTATFYDGWAVTQTSGTPLIPGGAYITSIDSPSQIHISSAASGTASGLNLQFGGAYSPPAQIFDFDPVANTISPVSPALADTTTLNGEPVFVLRMLMLPNGQVLVNDGSYQLWIYTPDGTAPSQYQPVTTNVAYNGNGLFTLTGTQINGQNAGATYGDDSEMDENYPIVSLVNSSGNVYYGRTTNWSNVGVATGSTPETVNFTLNSALTAGNYSLVVSGAGIQSAPTPITITSAEVSGQATNPSDSISGQVTLNGAPFAGVTVSLNTGSNTVTDASGNYSFPSLTAATTYTVTPSLSSYQFSPANQVITTTNPGNQVANFASSAVAGTNSLGFVPVTPCRVVDTRGVNGSLGGPSMTAGSTRSFPLPMGSCTLPAGASAYSLNVTVVPKSKLNYLTLWPTGQTQPVVSTLNSLDGRVVANAAIVPSGTSGDVNVYVTDNTDVIIDVNGYFGPAGSSGALTFVPVTPCRVEDTRNSNGTFGGPILAASSTRSFPIPSSSCGIPSTAAAYSLNETVVPTTTLEYLSLFPTGASQPNVSTLNATKGHAVANAAIVPAGTGGAVSAYVTDQTQLISDINGYFTATPSTALVFNTVTPCRVADTRNATGTFGGPIMAANTTRTFPLPTGSCGLPSSAAAYALNVTVVPTSTLNYLTLWPAGQSQPTVSTLNSATGQVVANAALVPAGTSGGVSVYVTNQTQVIIDVVGYFSAP
jgi:hypothetical protein